MHNYLMALALAGSATLLPGAAQAQTGDLGPLLDEIGKVYSEKGFSEAGWAQQGQLGQGDTTTLTVPLKGGKTYQIAGACDGDCSDFDLQIFDAGGTQIDKDDEKDDFPIVGLAVPANQTYTLKVNMVACKADPCGFAVRAYVKN